MIYSSSKLPQTNAAFYAVFWFLMLLCDQTCEEREGQPDSQEQLECYSLYFCTDYSSVHRRSTHCIERWPQEMH